MALIALVFALPVRAAPPDSVDLLSLSLEQLGDIQITSVSRRSERLSEAPASIFVINNEDIRRYGATSLPEALRLAPNLQVARVSASAYAISARGFNNSLGNKLLVLIDGRTIYTPLFSGVFWDSQDVLLEDVERIEVISGPGATLWGANAVNGVINVITRPATSTRGLLASVEAGDEGRGALLRYGGPLGTEGGFRVYAKHAVVDRTENAAGEPLPDRWERDLFGFRADWGNVDAGFTVQGDHHEGQSELRPFGPIQISGTNLIASWHRRSSAGTNLRVRAYLDRTERDDPLLFHDRMDIVDVEMLHDIPLDGHNLVWGAGYRRAQDEVEHGLLGAFFPVRRNLHWENVFVQDEMQLRDSLRLTVGLKLDRNVYTGTEVLPSLRLAWSPAEDRLVWGSASRAVRAPSRIDREFFFPGTPPFLITGGPDFVSEVSDVVELGYRAQPTAAISVSVTAFHHRHDRLRSGEPQPDGSFQVQNGTAGRSTGIEAWANWQVTERWRLSAGAIELRQRFHTKPGSHDPDGPVDLGNDPRHQWSLRSSLEVSPTLAFDVFARRVGTLPEPRISAYSAVDASLTWRPNPRVELALIGRNLLDSGHQEFAPGPLVAASEYGRSGSVRLSWQW